MLALRSAPARLSDARSARSAVMPRELPDIWRGAHFSIDYTRCFCHHHNTEATLLRVEWQGAAVAQFDALMLMRCFSVLMLMSSDFACY